MRLLMNTALLLLCAASAYAQEIPDKAVQAAYCEGVVMGQIKFAQDIPQLDCENTPLDKSLCNSIKASSNLDDTRNRYMKIYSYVELYSQNQNAKAHLLNFTIAGIGDYNDYMKSLQATFPKCLSHNQAKIEACVKANVIKSDKVEKCMKFDPTDF